MLINFATVWIQIRHDETSAQRGKNDGDDNEEEDNDDLTTDLTTTYDGDSVSWISSSLLYRHRLLCFICIVLMRNSKLTLSNSDVPCRIKLI